jgi:hypothetical protein
MSALLGGGPSRIFFDKQNWDFVPAAFRGSKAVYRAYLINHEIGHAAFRLDHASQRATPGQRCRVMYQQTKGTPATLCDANPWPSLGEEESKNIVRNSKVRYGFARGHFTKAEKQFVARVLRDKRGWPTYGVEFEPTAAKSDAHVVLHLLSRKEMRKKFPYPSLRNLSVTIMQPSF